MTSNPTDPAIQERWNETIRVFRGLYPTVESHVHWFLSHGYTIGSLPCQKPEGFKNRFQMLRTTYERASVGWSYLMANEQLALDGNESRTMALAAKLIFMITDSV